MIPTSTHNTRGTVEKPWVHTLRNHDQKPTPALPREGHAEALWHHPLGEDARHRRDPRDDEALRLLLRRRSRRKPAAGRGADDGRVGEPDQHHVGVGDGLPRVLHAGWL